jgi:hypothetical protein
MNADSVELLLALFATAAAMGLSVYAALALPGIAAYLGLIQLPEALTGLATPAVWIALLGLMAVEALVTRYRFLDLVWNALHTLVRAPAAALFVSAAMADAPRGTQWAAALSALAVAFAVHTSCLAVHTAGRTAGPAPRAGGFAAVQLALAAGMGTLAWSAPVFAAAAALALLLAPLPWAPRLWGAASLAVRGLFAILSRPDRLHRWDTGERGMPGWLRRVVEDELETPISRLRSARVTLARYGPRWPYIRGRIVVAQDRTPLFAHRRGFRTSLIRLEPGPGRADHGALVETVEVDAATPYALCLCPDAPPGPAILTDVEG